MIILIFLQFWLGIIEKLLLNVLFSITIFSFFVAYIYLLKFPKCYQSFSSSVLVLRDEWAEGSGVEYWHKEA